MTDEDRDGRDGRSGGPFDALGALDDVQRQALDAAMRIASGLGELGGRFGDAPWTRASADDAGAGSVPTMDVGRLRGDVMRAAETFAELVRATLDVGFDALDELARRPATPAVTRVAPGAAIALVVTVRNEGEPLRDGRPLVPALLASDGTPLDAVVTTRPEALGLEPYERAGVTVDLHVSPTAATGHYHGLLLVSGLAGVAERIDLEVVEDAEAGRDHD